MIGLQIAMTENLTNVNNLFSDLLEKNPAYAETRQKAFARFQAQGLPTRQNEDWKYTSLKPLQNSWTLATLGKIPASIVAKDRIRIFSQNGFFDIENVRSILKPFGVDVISSDAILQVYDQIPDMKKTFWSLSHAFMQSGLILKVAANKQVHLPIEITHLVDGENLFVHPYVAYTVENGASVTVIEKYKGNETSWFNSATSAMIGELSVLNLFKTYESRATQVDNNYFQQNTNSTFRFVNFGVGSKLLRSETMVKMVGEGATCDLRGIAVLKQKNQMDHNIRVHHTVPNSFSRQAFKSILRDESHYVFQGNIHIDSVAQKTDAAQINKNLLLSKKCRVDIKPQIDVYADDVKATHGSATGQLNSEEKFYLETRGMSTEKAMGLLCDGFAKSILENIPESVLLHDVLQMIEGANHV